MASLNRLNDEKLHFIYEREKNCCGSQNIIAVNGYLVCTNCGTTQGKVISYSPKRQFFLERETASQNFEPVRSPIGPRTIIKGTQDGKGNYLSPNALEHFKKLSKIHGGLISGFEKNLWIAIPKLNQIKTYFNLPNYIIEDTLKIYIYAVKKKLTLGRTINGILCASLYFILKFYRKPIVINELLLAFNISKKKFAYCYGAMINNVMPNFKMKMHNFTPQEYINKFYEELDLSINCRNIAIKVVEESKKKGLITSGKDPKGIAAASLYISSKKNEEHRTQKEICRIANVSEITLRMRLKEISSLI
jgi:transcription initiation factor TFIIB